MSQRLADYTIEPIPSESGDCSVDAHDVEQMTILFTRVAKAAKADPRVAEQVREALASSGLLRGLWLCRHS